ncbi:pyruvate, phosphate dikinase [Vagococcus elongatus]|uniref:Pyruvate, phosphate dikinase n=1 Tax=Vagococcus elongatus TaxID=180344 RepID=A0A430API9_9ENTE|nr:pyruvate, phosphate dikinase [Vagococcus elongatus]RSU09824.1 pyruvate, phosphate dikinase [Vagococcus elongatus]
MKKNVYQFSEGNAEMKPLLGGKGANLAEMVKLGLPVPEGFTITTEACMTYLTQDHYLTEDLKSQILTALKHMESSSGKKFDDTEKPLLVSVRSGSMYSMPGMMDTILNLGLNDKTVESLAEQTQNERFAYDCYRRLLQMFGEVVFGIESQRFEQYLTHVKEKNNYASDNELTAEDLKEIVKVFKEIYLESVKKEFPQGPIDQLFMAVEAVFRSWNNHRAQVYRRLHGIADDLGTAVNIQTMVFGNSGQKSGTGVAFTRSPATGDKHIFGEYLINAQGEDVVAGIRTPEPIDTLAEKMPKAYEEFIKIADLLENHYQDMQDIEFTIEEERLFVLQTRSGKRTAAAAFKIAYDLKEEGVISKEQALMHLKPEMIDQLLHPVFSKEVAKTAQEVARGLPASPGAATGRVVFDAGQAKKYVEDGEEVILVRRETSPEDVEGMSVSNAIVTSCGGMTSHAAVVARGMGICCVVACANLTINEAARSIIFDGGVIEEGDFISVDGSNGIVFLGKLEMEKTEESSVFKTIMSWADEVADLNVRVNAETPKDLTTAFAFGAQGVGLTRTEHMFFEGKRLTEMRRLILAGDSAQRKAPLKKLLEIQIEDFTNIFNITQEKAIVIRLLDPPLHEFLPHGAEEIRQLAKELELTEDYLEKRVHSLMETNPMLGHRGCRLGVTFPEIYEMQVEAIIRSACGLVKKGINVAPEIMIPLVGVKKELTILKELLIQVADKIIAEENITLDYTIGTMIEIPRACFIADQLAEEAEFFSFGTNDLTQLTYGYSRDDAGKFITTYQQKKLLPADPFQKLDVEGVGELMRIAVERGRQVKPDLKIGVCGEVGGDPSSIAFFQQLGLNYVSCSPYRVPIARLAVAQAAIMK